MDVRIQALSVNLSTLQGLSEKLIRSHHENNYSGAVKRLNAIRAQLAAVPFATPPGFVYGHEVGRATALRLRAAGLDAGFLGGGYDGWR